MDQEVLELDRNRRLQEVQARLDPRAQAEVKGGGAFRGGELLRRKLIHEGTLTWKVQGSRMKGRRGNLGDTWRTPAHYTHCSLQMCRSC